MISGLVKVFCFVFIRVCIVFIHRAGPGAWTEFSEGGFLGIMSDKACNVIRRRIARSRVPTAFYEPPLPVPLCKM